MISYSRQVFATTLLHFAVDVRCHRASGDEDGNLNEEPARWLIDNAADINAMNNQGTTVFSFACQRMSPSFVEELAGKVPPDHLALPDNDDESPMRRAFVRIFEHSMRIYDAPFLCILHSVHRCWLGARAHHVLCIGG